MPANPTCTYGSSKTAVLGGNNLYFQEYNDTQTVKMQINFSWPVGNPIYLIASYDHEGQDNDNFSRKYHLAHVKDLIV